MGCAGSRDDISKDENRIISMESQLNYANSDCRTVDFYHRKYSYMGEINYDQWMDIAKFLNLNIENSRNNPRVKEMIGSFRNENGNYQWRKLTIFGILLSKGHSNEKAILLFQLFDNCNQKALPYGKILKLPNLMIKRVKTFL